MSPMSAEATVVRNYLDWMLSIPWKKRSKISKDLKRAQQILDEDHFGLEKVKERILEYLAVQQRVDKMKGPILCLVGRPASARPRSASRWRAPPAQLRARSAWAASATRPRSAATAHLHRLDAGKIVQSMKKAKTSNPLFMLGRAGQDGRRLPRRSVIGAARGPGSEQNNNFNDHYLEVDYDLSDVMFVCTANTLRMPQPLQDRLEIIRLAGYTRRRIEIARRHLMPKQLDAGSSPTWSLSADALTDLIRYYTRGRGAQSRARDRQPDPQGDQGDPAEDKKRIRITRRNLETYAGVRKFRYGEAEHEDLVGSARPRLDRGRRRTAVDRGGHPARQGADDHGQARRRCRESVQAAKSYVRSRSVGARHHSADLRQDRHPRHMCPRATPKDGPSAGVAMVTSIVSVLTKIPVRAELAMTGEITLRGRVLPIGGLKEKLRGLARRHQDRADPKENEDLAEIPDMKKALDIVPVAMVDEVWRRALVRVPEPVGGRGRAERCRRRCRRARAVDTTAQLTGCAKRARSAAVGARLPRFSSEPLTTWLCPDYFTPTYWRLLGTLYHCHGGCTVNKNDLIAAVAERCGMSKADVGRAVDATLDTITEALKKDDTVGRLRHVDCGRACRVGRAQSAHRSADQDSCVEAGAVQGGKALKDA